jgi:predicted metal-dependent enzyme (double-stranded beta helix superfamily)
MSTTTVSIAIDAFIGDVKAIIAQQDESEVALEQIAARMAAFIADETVLAAHEEKMGNIHTGRQSSPLYVDESGLTLVRARFGPEQPTPIHSHGTWGVVGVYKGRDRYEVWRRLDDGTGEGYAEVEMVEERILEPGDVAIIPSPPQDIHAQQGYDGEETYEFVLFGANAMILPRLYFDPEQKLAREVVLAAQ